MMSKTHIAMGIGTSLLFLHPHTVTGMSAAIIGAAFGAVIPDIDCKSTRIHRDVFYGRVLAGAIIAVSAFWGHFQQVSLLKSILQTHVSDTIFMGILLMSILCFTGRISEHRSFPHSFLFFILMSGAVFLIYPPFLPGFSMGFLSHLLLDCLNKKPVRLFFPVKTGFCMKLCYADGIANTALLWVGVLLSVCGFVLAWLQ